MQSPVSWYYFAVGKKHNFEERFNSLIELAYQRSHPSPGMRGPSAVEPVFTIEMYQGVYRIDFFKMVQVNIASGKQRKVERVVNYCWRWQGKHHYPFDYEASRDIELNYRLGNLAFVLSINNTKYKIDLKAMVQTNLSSSRSRSISRYPAAIPSSPNTTFIPPKDTEGFNEVEDTAIVLDPEMQRSRGRETEKKPEAPKRSEKDSPSRETPEGETDQKPGKVPKRFEKDSPSIETDKKPEEVPKRSEKDNYAEFYVRNKHKEPLATILKTNCSWDWEDNEYQQYLVFWEKSIK